MLRRTRFEPVAAPNCESAGSGCAGTPSRSCRRRFRSSVAIISRSVICLLSRKNFDETWRSRSFSLKPSSRRREQRIFRPLVSQRIHPRDRVTERAIGVNQTVDAGLQRAFASPPCAERPSRRRRRCAASVPELETFEKRATSWIDGLGILLPAPIIFLDQIEVAAGRKRWTHDFVICQPSAGGQVDSAEACSDIRLQSEAAV